MKIKILHNWKQISTLEGNQAPDFDTTKKSQNSSL